MKHEPHDFEAPTRRAELKEWLATLRGMSKRDRAIQRQREETLNQVYNEMLDYLQDDPMKRHT